VQPETRVEIVTSALMTLNGYHLVILEMIMVLDVAMTTGHHQDRHPLVPFAVGKVDTAQETERQIDSTDVTDVGHGLLMVESDAFGVLARGLGRDMMRMTLLFYAEHQERFQICRYWLLMMLTSKILYTVLIY
jgi:hypothetical protein